MGQVVKAKKRNTKEYEPMMEATRALLQVRLLAARMYVLVRTCAHLHGMRGGVWPPDRLVLRGVRVHTLPAP